MNTGMMYIAFLGFLLVNVFIGLWSGRKVKTMRDYAFANQSLGLGVLTITFLATFVEIGHISFDVPFRVGMISSVTYACYFFSLAFLFGRMILPRLRHFEGCRTLSDVTKRLYCKEASLLTDFLSILLSLVRITAQMVYMGVFGRFLGFSSEAMVLIVGGAIVLYSALGGIRTITSTYILQFALLIVGMTVITQAVFAKVGGIQKVFTDLRQKDSSLLEVKSDRLGSILVAAIFLTVFFADFFYPPFFQRYQMVRDKRRLKGMFLSSAIFYATLCVMCLLVGLAIHSFPNAAEYVKPAKVERAEFIRKLLEDLGSIPKVLGFLMILAVGFSTADSYLGAVGVLVAHSIRPLLVSKKEGEDDEKAQLVWARWASVLLGVGCTLFALFPSVGFIRVTLFVAIALFGMLFIPVVSGVIGLRVHKNSFWANCIVYFLVGIVGYLIVFQAKYFYAGTTFVNGEEKPVFNSIQKIVRIGLFSMVMGAAVFFITNYQTFGGLYLVQREEKKKWFPERPRRCPLRNCFGWLTAPLVWAQKKVARYGKEPTLAPMFLCISMMIPHVSPTADMQKSMHIWLVVSIIGMFLCAGLLIQDSWPDSWQCYKNVYWFFTMMYCIPFTHVLWFLNDHKDNLIVLVRVAVAILLMIVLVDWYSFLLLSGIGAGTACLIQYLLKGGAGFDFSYKELWPIGFGLGYVFLVGALFVRRQEVATRTQIDRAKILSSSLGHELGNTLCGAQTYVGFLASKVKSGTQVDAKGEERLVLEGEAFQSFRQNVQTAERLLNLTPRQIKMFRQMIQFDGVSENKLRTVPIDCALHIARNQFALIHSEHADVIELSEGQEPFLVRIWDDLFVHVIVNLTKNAIVHGGAQRVSIYWNAQERAVYVEDDGRGIDADAVPYIFDAFYTTRSTGTGVGLSFVRHVMHAFYGEIHLVGSSKAGTSFKLTFPALSEEGIRGGVRCT